MFDLNNKSISDNVNTVYGAKQLAFSLLEKNTKRLNHTLGVVRKVKYFCKQLNLSKEISELLIQSAYLHDIGYADKCNIVNFHAVDGFNYLKNAGWGSSLCNTVLYHSYSKLLAEMSRTDLMYMYDKNKTTSEEDFLIHVLTDADLQTSADGEDVTFDERVLGIKDRYPLTSDIVKHIEKVKQQHIFLGILDGGTYE